MRYPALFLALVLGSCAQQQEETPAQAQQTSIQNLPVPSADAGEKELDSMIVRMKAMKSVIRGMQRRLDSLENKPGLATSEASERNRLRYSINEYNLRLDHLTDQYNTAARHYIEEKRDSLKELVRQKQL